MCAFIFGFTEDCDAWECRRSDWWSQIARSQDRKVARSQGCKVARSLMRWCDMRRRISAFRDFLGLLFKSTPNICDAMDFASLFCSLLMSMGKHFTLSLRCDMAFRELNTKIYSKLYFWIFAKGPPLLDVIANIKQRGGLLVTTTVSPLDLDFSIVFSLFVNGWSKLCRKILILKINRVFGEVLSWTSQLPRNHFLKSPASFDPELIIWIFL